MILEAHLRKLEMKDCEYDAFFNKIDIEMIEYAFGVNKCINMLKGSNNHDF